ncbi:MAG: calcium-binding protein [Hyphomicrobium sp.]
MSVHACFVEDTMGSFYHSTAGLNESDLDGLNLLAALSSEFGLTLVAGSSSSTRLVYDYRNSAGDFLGSVHIDGQNLATGLGGISWNSISSVSGLGSSLTGAGGLIATPGGSSLAAIHDLVMGPNGRFFHVEDIGQFFDSSLLGEQGRNHLAGGSGSDFIVGAAGADYLFGGHGNDSFRLNYGHFLPGERIVGGNGDRDTIEVKLNTNPGATNDVDLTVGDITGIEILRYLATFRDNAWIGNHVTVNRDQIAAGMLAIWSSLGKDTLKIVNAAGFDFSTMSFTDWVDDYDSIIIETSIANFGVVTGTIRDDRIIVLGANGLLNGSTGNDTFVVGSGIASGVFEGGDGLDTIELNGADVRFNSDTHVERLIFTGAPSKVKFGIQSVGSELITGISDTTGSSGADTIVATGENIDFSGIVFANWNPAFDTITLTGTNVTGSRQADTINGYDHLNDELRGGVGGDILIGGGGNDALNGGRGSDSLVGGAGNDRMVGSLGDDRYVVDSAGDRTIEGVDAGIDYVISTVSTTLSANIEDLTLFGSGNLNGTGNALNNVITGTSSGNNILNGLEGNDQLTGASGVDTFVFNTALNSALNRDVITDFSHTDDRIRLDDAIFTAIGPVGRLSADAFFIVGSGQRDAEDRIYYNTTNGLLQYDADGIGAGAAITFAVLTGSPDDVDFRDFFVV